MACKSFLFIGDDNLSADLAIGDTIPLSPVTCKRGENAARQGNALVLCGKCKAFEVRASFELSATSAAPITVTTLADGVAVPGGTRTITVAGTSDQTAIDVQAVICNGCKCSSAVSFQLSGAAATLDGESIIVDEI